MLCLCNVTCFLSNIFDRSCSGCQVIGLGVANDFCGPLGQVLPSPPCVSLSCALFFLAPITSKCLPCRLNTKIIIIGKKRNTQKLKSGFRRIDYGKPTNIDHSGQYLHLIVIIPNNFSGEPRRTLFWILVVDKRYSWYMYEWHSLVNSHFKQIKITCFVEKFRVLLYIMFTYRFTCMYMQFVWKVRRNYIGGTKRDSTCHSRLTLFVPVLIWGTENQHNPLNHLLLCYHQQPWALKPHKILQVIHMNLKIEKWRRSCTTLH